MPRSVLPVILTSLLGASCSPGEFAWQAPPMASYRDSFAAAAGHELVASSSRDEVLDRICAGRVLWLGDHHRHSRLHGLHLELLQQLQRRGQRLVLGLEAIGSQDQALVDEFLAGRTTMAELRRAVRRRWPGSWLDDRDLDPYYFRALLELARRHSMPVFALEPTPRLALPARDARMARSITEAHERWPDRLLVVVVGQTHLLGQGDLVGRCGDVGEVVGGLPPAALLAADVDVTARGELWRTDTGVLWFAEMLANGAPSLSR